MKKLILTAIFFLFVTSAFSQVDLSNWKFVTNKVDGRVYALENITAIQGCDSGTLRIPLSFAYSKDTTSLTTKSYSCTDTLTDGLDTLSASLQGILETATSEISLANFKVGGATVAFELSYYLAIVTDDTLELSNTIDFTQGTVITIKPGSWKSSDVRFYDVSIFADWYLRRKGTVGTVEYNVTVEGQ